MHFEGRKEPRRVLRDPWGSLGEALEVSGGALEVPSGLERTKRTHFLRGLVSTEVNEGSKREQKGAQRVNI